MEDNTKIIMAHKCYETISDQIMFLNDEWVLKFNVKLNRYDKNGMDTNYHKEFLYYGRNNARKCKLIRTFRPYLSIEPIKKGERYTYKDVIRIFIEDMYGFTVSLKNAVGALMIKDAFKMVQETGMLAIDKALLKSKGYAPVVMNTTTDMKIWFDLSINTSIDNGIGGCRLYYSDTDSVFMNYNVTMSLYYFLTTFNMYEAGCLLVNYLGRPEFGTNLSSMDTSNRFSENNGGHRFLK